MGGLFSSDDDDCDCGAIQASQNAAVAAVEARLREEMTASEQKYKQDLEQMANATAKEREELTAKFQTEQAALAEKMSSERAQYEQRIQEKADTIKKAEENVAAMKEEMAKPVKDREARIAFVNSLSLPIKATKKLLMLGPKGTGKSTFLWLLNKGPQPEKSISDGTKEMVHTEGFIDTIGLLGWNMEDLLKLLVLLVYEGIPQDLIVFSNDRVVIPLTNLGLCGINQVMMVIMSGDFWKLYEDKKIRLVEDGQIKKVEPVEDLSLMYDLEAYDVIKNYAMGTPITHHDDIDHLINERQRNGLQPFGFLLQKLGNQFTVAMENDNIIDLLFRYIYIYEKNYKDQKLQFMNHASLQEFSTLA